MMAKNVTRECPANLDKGGFAALRIIKFNGIGVQGIGDKGKGRALGHSTSCLEGTVADNRVIITLQ